MVQNDGTPDVMTISEIVRLKTDNETTITIKVSNDIAAKRYSLMEAMDEISVVFEKISHLCFTGDNILSNQKFIAHIMVCLEYERNLPKLVRFESSKMSSISDWFKQMITYYQKKGVEFELLFNIDS